MRHLGAITLLAALALVACAPRARPHPHCRSGDPAGAIAGLIGGRESFFGKAGEK